jgi:hypothetical protein
MTRKTELKYIWEVADSEFFLDGFYYEDETEMFNGPYDTPEEAKEAFDYYVKHYL